jgi:hypothetical protein
MKENESTSERTQKFIKDMKEVDTKYYNQINKLVEEGNKIIAKKHFIKKPNWFDILAIEKIVSNLEQERTTTKTNLAEQFVKDLESLVGGGGKK